MKAKRPTRSELALKRIRTLVDARHVGAVAPARAAALALMESDHRRVWAGISVYPTPYAARLTNRRTLLSDLFSLEASACADAV